MAIAQGRLWAWVSQATAADRRTGFVEMTAAEFAAAELEGRAQDPRVGALHLKFITPALFVPPEPEPELKSLGAAATPTRRRRSSSSQG